MTSARFCQHCGHSLTPNDRFCPQCGTGQTPAPATPPPAQSDGPWSAITDRLARAVAPRYRVIRLIGHGGMAGVYLADEPRLGRRVALKVMAPGLMIDPALVTRFEQEARTTAQLNHPNIVTIFDVDSRDGLHFFVMAYVAGRTLGQITQQSAEPLPVRAILHWFAQAGSGLAYAHRMGIVHRDIKPANILVDGFGNALVTDFGIAKVADEPSLTRTGFLVGTPTYMSPEQCAAAQVTGASDQYSLAIVLYELLTGKPPFSGPTVSVLQAHVREKPRPVQELRPDCPPALAGAIDRMLLKSPADRFPTVAAAVTAAGASVLGDDDPLRERLGTVAAVAEALELPAVGALTPGEATALPARVLDVHGRPLPDRPIRWVSDTPALLSVNEEGVVYALAPGTARVTAWCDGIAATTSLVITPLPGPLTRLADEAAAVAAPASVTELFEPTPTPTAPAPAAQPAPEPEPVMHAVPLETEATPAEAVTVPPPEPPTDVLEDAPDEPSPAAATTPPVARPVEPEASDPAVVPVEPDRAVSNEPERVAPAASIAPAVNAPAPSAAPPRRAAEKPPRRSIRAPVIAGVAVLAIVLVAAIALIDGGGGAESGNPPPDPPVSVPPDAAGGTTDQAPTPPLAAVADSAEQLASGSDTTPTLAAQSEARGAADPARAQTPPATPPPAPQQTTPERPATGLLRITGTLPTGARVTLSGPGADGVVWQEGNGLRPGSYTVQVTAPDFEPYSGTVTIRAGETATISPQLRAQAAPAQPEAQRAEGDAAAEAAVRNVIGAFGKSLESRDLAAIARQYPASAGLWSESWQLLIGERRAARDLVTEVKEIATEVDGDGARATFTLELRFRDIYNAAQQASSRFEASLRRQGTDWTITTLRENR